MEKYLTLKLPSPLSSKVLKHIKNLQLSHSLTRQKLRFFCNRYAHNPAALTHFPIEKLIDTPQVWQISTPEHTQRQQWLQEVYPSIEENNEISQKRSILSCGRCGQNKVDYYEMQICGADEPMTVFAHCLNCGKQWTDDND